MTSTLLFAAGIVGFIIIVLLFLSFVNKRHKQKQAEKQAHFFSKAAKAFGITVHKKDPLLHRIIGCNEQENRIIFVDYSEQPYRQTLIELKDMAGSKLIINSDTVSENIKGVEKVTDRFTSSIQLKVQFKNINIAPVVLPFYEYGIDAAHDIEIGKQGAETWNGLINKNCG